MKRLLISFLGLSLLVISACSDEFPGINVQIPDFNYPQTVDFETELAAYEIFQGEPGDLVPSEDFHLLELSSILFTDYAYKQRLVHVPAGTQMTRLADGSVDYPEGTILVKTFYYYDDERTQEDRKIIETRLLIKKDAVWNAATYLWNADQNAATLELAGHDTDLSWINALGNTVSTRYHVPSENECINCHQSNQSMTPLGPSMLNLNRMVVRDGVELNQLAHLQALGILNEFEIAQVAEIPDYNNLNIPLSERARAYLALNCAHCHNPEAWDQSSARDFDFRYQTSFSESGIERGKEKILRTVVGQQMPLIGTTLLDQDGVSLLIEYIEGL